MGYVEVKKNPEEKATGPPCTWHDPESGVIKLDSDGAIREDL
jgi:hypothetical protein